MSSLHTTKLSAAQRQLDAAIRMLFNEEDPLAVHTVAAAAHGILQDVSRHRGSRLEDEISGTAFIETFRKLLDREPTSGEVREGLPDLKILVVKRERRPANFLKHADRDPNGVIDERTMATDHILLKACVIYADLGLEWTPEMSAFLSWHLAIYPSEPGDELQTGVGPLSGLSRADQLEAGEFLLRQYRGE